ncbi:MAG: hypothetical protein ACI9VM_000266 [Candidatus Azotimanducaceae bacterium]|jgi:hypothetical protein
MSYEKLVQTIRGSFYETLLVGALLTIAFMAIEPVVGRSQVTDEFTVTQTVAAGIAFAAPTGDVTMVGTLDGSAGGTSYGTTTARVTTNNTAGYNMTIDFASTTAMIRNSGTSAEIQNYLYSTGTASYPSGYDVTQPNAQFGFSVNASDTTEVSDIFTNTGSACGTGNNAGFNLNVCWRGASSTDEAADTELINTSSQTTGSGSTSTVQFRITIPNSPSPSVPNGTYVATATLTATLNP